jgi:hypothetical protein
MNARYSTPTTGVTDYAVADEISVIEDNIRDLEVITSTENAM